MSTEMSILFRLKRIVLKTDTKAGRIFDSSIQLLVLISIISFSAESLPNLPPAWQVVLRWTEIVMVAIFTIEYLLRVIVSDSPRKFIFSFYGLIDLLAILPFYLGIGIDLRSLRIVRFLRVFRMFKLVRYGHAIERLRKAFSLIREELVLFAVVVAILLYISAVGIYFFERDAQPEQFASVFHSLWWAIVTLTTVGYGDIYPVTIGGRLFTGIILIIGLGLVAVPTSLFASALSKVRHLEVSEDSNPEKDSSRS